MAENQPINQEEAYWRRVVLRWVKCAQLDTGIGYNDLAACYNNFRCKIKDCHDLQECTVVEFLRVKFPHFELELGKENEIPETDAIYVFSLMLYYSCVRHSIPYFQNICQELDVVYQHSMKAFLNSFVPEHGKKIVITRAFMDEAFQNAKRSATVLSVDSSNRQPHSQHSVQLLTSTPIGKQEMKKPSPPTPKSVALEWKVKNLNAMLESARTENITQERQIEQLLQNVSELQEEKKRFQQKISVLQLKETCACACDSAELSHPTNRVTAQLQKQIETNNKIIEELQEEISKAKESAQTAMERYTELKTQYAATKEDNQRLKMAAEDLKEEITLRDNINQNLTESVNDLRRFIRENHIRGAELMEPLESSFEFLDKSFKNMTSDDSQCYDSENLASTVVDIKLKEKEHENEQLAKKVLELEATIQDMLKLHNEMLEQRQTEASTKITELQRSLAEAEEYKSLHAQELDKHNAEKEDLIGQLESQKALQIAERNFLLIETEKKLKLLCESYKMHCKKQSARTQDLESRVVGMTEKVQEVVQVVEEVQQDRALLTNKLERAEIRVKDLTGQLESQDIQHIEKRVRLQNAMQQKITELQRCIDKVEKNETHLAEELKKEQAKTQDLTRELDTQQNLQADMTEQITALLHTLADAEKIHSQIAEDAQKRKTEIVDLNSQLKSQKQLQREELERLQAEMNEKTTVLQRRLDEVEEMKTYLENDFKKAQAKTQDLNHELDGKNELIVELRQTVTYAEKERLQFTNNLERGEARIEDLMAQLESKKKIQIEERERLQAETAVKIKELQSCLDTAKETEAYLTDELKKEQAKTQGLTRELDTQQKLQVDMNEQSAALRQSLADAEMRNSQNADNLEKGKAEREDLIDQLEVQKQLQIQERERQQAEMNEKIAELQRCLNEAVESKMCLKDDLGKDHAKIENLTCQLESQKNIQIEERERLQTEMNVKIKELQRCLDTAEESEAYLTEELKKEQEKTQDLTRELETQQNLQVEMNEKTAALRQALADAEMSYSQIAENLEKSKAEREDLIGQLEVQKQLQIQERERQQAEMNEKIAELQRCLNEAVESKMCLKDDLGKDHAKIEDLTCQLESQKNIQIEERERLQAEMNVKIKELQRCLDTAKGSETYLAEELKKEQAKKQDRTRELDTQQKLQVDMNEQIAALQQSLADAEKDKPQLLGDLAQSNSKIADLIGQLELQKKLQLEEYERLQFEMEEKTADMQQALAAAETDKSQFADQLEKEKIEREDLIRQLESQKKLQMEERERLQVEMDVKIAEMRQALDDAEKNKTQLIDELNSLKRNEGFVTSLRTEMLEKISVLQQSLEQEKEKSEEINCQYMQMKKQADDLDAQCTKLMQTLSEDRSGMANLQKELAGRDAKLEELNALYEEKQKQFEKSYQDNEILSVKLYKARLALKEKEDAWTKSLQEAKKAMEANLRDARVEFDSTMEKMKERMKELHKEVKTKLEFDNQGLALTAEGYRRKVDNLEIRCSKLQQQLAEMNERNLEVRKENQHLHIKLKTFEDFGNDRKSLMLPTQASLRSNLRMEDEEGELFNNMYLTDLKSGRCVSPGPTNGGLDRYSELSQRNSKLLPHLRTNYVALAPDCDPPSHDDTRDTMSTTFDDSSTGLISRRKVSGITSYKRPGPPTPSKRAGRLSLNGNGNGGEIQYKDALRDANANAATGGASSGAEPTGTTRTGRTKTPGKFKQMISSSSLLNNFQRDEGNTSATTRRVHQSVTDNTQDMPSNGPIRFNAVAKRKRLQRKMLFDSNRCLANGSPPYHQDCAVVPLGTILECPIPKEKSLEEDNVYANFSPVDVVKPMAPVTTTLLAMTRTTSTLTDITTATTTTPTLATATHIEPVTALAASDYSFKHPYGSNRYNILRMQVQSREKRRQLYDETRKVAAKGITSGAIGSPTVGVTVHSKDENDENSTSDITMYHSFTSDTDDSYKLPVPMCSTISRSVRYTGTPLLLILLAYSGFLALMLFLLGNFLTTKHDQT